MVFYGFANNVSAELEFMPSNWWCYEFPPLIDDGEVVQDARVSVVNFPTVAAAKAKKYLNRQTSNGIPSRLRGYHNVPVTLEYNVQRGVLVWKFDWVLFWRNTRTPIYC